MSDRIADVVAPYASSIFTLLAGAAVVGILVTGPGNEADNPVRCDCRCHRCDDGDSGCVVLDSRLDTGEVRR